MTLQPFIKEKNVEAKKKPTKRQLLEAKGYVFNDEKGYVTTPKGNKFPIAIPRKKQKKDSVGRLFVPSGLTKTQRIMKQFPEVDRWLRTKYNSRGTWEVYAYFLIGFCIAKDITPKQFAELRHNEKEQDKAIDLASEHIQDLLFEKKFTQATGCVKALKSFYQFHSKGRKILALDTKGSLEIKIEDMRSKERPHYAWGPPSEIRRKQSLIIPSARDLFDRMALTFLFRTGCRKNVLRHLKIKDVQDRFELENPNTGKKEQVLCLTIYGYNQDAKEGIAEKIEHYGFPKLPDDPQQRHGYYTFLAKDSLELFDKFLEKYHPNPKPDDYIFYRLSDKTKPLGVDGLSRRFKTVLKRSNFPAEKITLHQYRELFTELAEATMSKADSYRADFLVGHMLDGMGEKYHRRNKIADGQAYLKIDFGTPTEEQIIESQKEVERLREENRKIKEAMEKAQVTTEIEVKPLTIPSGPLGGSPPIAKEPSYEEPKRDFQQAKPQLPKSEPLRHTKPIQKPSISMKRLQKDDWVVCPDRDDWVRKSVECKKCGEDNFKKFSECYKERTKNPFGPIFKCSKPKPNL